MRCPVQEGHPEVLLDYCARTLAPDAAAILAHHMGGCEQCRALAESQEFVWSALDSWRAPRISDDFNDRLYRRIAIEPRASRWRRLTGSLNWKPALTVALAGSVMALMLLIPDNSERPAQAARPEIGRAETLEPEQVDRAVEDLEMLRQFSTTSSRQTL